MTDTAWLVVALASVGAAIGGYAASLLLRRRWLEARLASFAPERTEDDVAATERRAR